MKLKIRDYIFLTFVIIGLFLLVIQKSTSNFDSKEILANETIQNKKIRINKKKLLVKVVSTEELRFRGLGGVDVMRDNEGMLFVHEFPGEYIYSMREMKFDLDFIFINDDRIVDIAKSVSYRYTGTIKGGAEYDKVLEVNADWVRKNDVKVGDLVDLGK